MAQGQFAISIAKWVEETKEKADAVCRAIALELTTRIVLKSPVGNPELWAANAEAALQRSQHNAVVDQINANLASDPANLTAKGNLRRKVRSASNKRLSKSQLAKQYPFKSGRGYVGGRFRANWFVTIGSPATGTTEHVDPSGSIAISNASAALAGFKAGPSIYIVQNLPYGPRLEYEGWSKQAPAGMVRITLAEIDGIVQQSVQSVQS